MAVLYLFISRFILTAPPPNYAGIISLFENIGIQSVNNANTVQSKIHSILF